MDEGLLPGETPGIYKPRPDAVIKDYSAGLIAPQTPQQLKESKKVRRYASDLSDDRLRLNIQICQIQLWSVGFDKLPARGYSIAH